ncbi:MAG: ACP S-malonyltransferase [bacterium]|nr:ACP S-malonyltransferase [bacterium]
MSQNIAFVFPGQGSQKVGMGRDWAEAFDAARAVFEEADDALGFELSRLCWEGPEEELQLTANTQPAILTCSVAMARVVATAGLDPVAMAGHSLGEYSALVTSGALDFATALGLVRRRGELMQEAVPVGVGAMAAIMGIDAEAVAGVVVTVSDKSGSAEEVCAVANLNSPQQTVIAGHRATVESAVALAKERGARIAKMLPVSAPFHSPLMRPAREALEPLLAEAEIRSPAVPVVSNIDAAPVASGEEARDALGRQVDGPVRWVESVRWMIDEAGAETFLEVGFGKVLTGLGKRIERGVRWAALPEPAAALEFLAGL